jgi:hypothetical protein
VAGEFEEFAVAQRVDDVKAEVAGLAGTEKFARTSEEAGWPYFLSEQGVEL